MALSEVERLRRSVDTFSESCQTLAEACIEKDKRISELEQMADKTNNLLDILKPEIEWQEEHIKDIPKWKREWWDHLIGTYRALIPKEVQK